MACASSDLGTQAEVAAAHGTTQTTGAAQVLGLAPGYPAAFPAELRLLSGSLGGVLIAQQTASNLHVAPGDTVTVARPGAKPAHVTVRGVVDLPYADSLFQKVGALPGAQATAPPDNVLILPYTEFARVEGPVIAGRPDLIHTQIHATLSHALPSSPTAAFDQIAARAHNLESRLTRAGVVGENLGAALDTARQDALYAQILFLFLGVPGAILAGLVTGLIASAGAGRRRRDAALLRTRGASTSTLVRRALAEAMVAAVAGVVVGLGAALLIGQSSFGTASFGAGTVSAILWSVGAAIVGLTIAAWSIALPALRDARALTVAGRRRQIGRVDAARCGRGLGSTSPPWRSPPSSTGRHPRTATSSCSRPRAWRRCRSTGTRCPPPFWGGRLRIADVSARRSAPLLARAAALVALTAAFAGSTYQAQAEVDARLSNGADVTVTESPAARVGPQQGVASSSASPVSPPPSRCSIASRTSGLTCRTSTASGRRRSPARESSRTGGSPAARPQG